MDEQRIIMADLLRYLTDRFNERLTFNIADGAADFCDDNICVGLFSNGVDKRFDFIGNMRNNLNGFAQIFPVSLFSKNVPVHFAGGEIGKPV